jgi:hypothetical protein
MDVVRPRDGGGARVIATYLHELKARLPVVGRRRALAEAEAHLLDATERHRTAGVPSAEAERRAVAEFGPVELVAARLRRELGEAAARPIALLVLAAALLFVVPLYGIPENTLPPAPWDSMPETLAWLRDAAVALWLAAVVLAGIGLATRLPAVSGAALGCLAASATAGAVLVVRWDVEAPATPAAKLLALTIPLTAAAVLVPAACLVYARRLRATAP